MLTRPSCFMRSRPCFYSSLISNALPVRCSNRFPELVFRRDETFIFRKYKGFNFGAVFVSISGSFSYGFWVSFWVTSGSQK